MVSDTGVVGMMNDKTTIFMEVVDANSAVGKGVCWHLLRKINRFDQLLDRYGRGW